VVKGNEEEKIMRYKKLGKSGIELSAITIGTWAMGATDYGSTDRNDAIAAVGEMLDQGVNHIDTAWIYGCGGSDKVVGEALKELKVQRDKIFITTKCGFHNNPDPTQPNFPDCSPEWITKCFEESLVNLGTDYVDFFLVHVPDKNVPFEKTAEVVNKWIKEGKVRYAGVSNFGIDDIKEMGQYLDIVGNQSGLSMLNRGEQANMEWCRDNGIGVMTHSSLAQGMLTGAIKEFPKYEKGDVRMKYGSIWYTNENVFNAVQSDLLDVLRKMSAEIGKPVAQISLNWNTQKDFVTTSLCGVRNVHEAKENCAAASWELTDEQMKTIDQAIDKMDFHIKDILANS
jgi:aryl-alcohol dehydrogenase-like predicted oxidoreductase